MADRPGIPGCAQWVEAHLGRELTPFQVRAVSVLVVAFGSPWNSPWRWRNVDWLWGEGMSVCAYTSPATYDSDHLTRLVVAAHDECVRVEIAPATPRQLRLSLWPRERTATRLAARHPTIEEAITRIRPRVGLPAGEAAA